MAALKIVFIGAEIYFIGGLQTPPPNQVLPQQNLKLKICVEAE
jgi:hypothetical protein